MILLYSCERFLFFSMSNFFQSECNADGTAPEADRENNLVAEKMLLASAACE